jgi:hypothetical protein
MKLRWLLPILLVIILCLPLPVNAHVPVSADGNNDLGTALNVEKPTKSYVIYGHLHEAGEVAWYKLSMNPGERLVLSLMTPGYNTTVPDMIVMAPADSLPFAELPPQVSVPQGYRAELIRGEPPLKAEYEPFGPSAVFEAASYTKEITEPQLWYVAVVSPADETRYSIAVGYVEEFTPSEWVLVPFNVIYTHLWEGQSTLAILTPFLAVVILGFIVISRNAKQKNWHRTHSGWLATIAGLCYLGGAAITLVQMVRAIAITGPASSVVLTFVFAIIPIALGIWALRMGRSSLPMTIRERFFLVLIGISGLVFWAGLIIGPVLAISAAVLPAHVPFQDPPNK